MLNMVEQHRKRFCLVILIAMIIRHAETECSRRPVMLIVRYSNCVPKRMMAYACRGTCASHIRPSRFRQNVVERFCECCQDDRTVLASTKVRCPSRDGRLTRIVRFPVALPLSCRCRPCDVLPLQIISPEEELLNGRKRSVNVTDMEEELPKGSKSRIHFTDVEEGLLKGRKKSGNVTDMEEELPNGNERSDNVTDMEEELPKGSKSSFNVTYVEEELPKGRKNRISVRNVDDELLAGMKSKSNVADDQAPEQ